MTILQLTEEQRDALQEIANIGIGQAGDSIARVLGEFVQLSVPQVMVLGADSISKELARIVGEKEISAMRQTFHGELRGEAIVIFPSEGCHDLADLMGYEAQSDSAGNQEMLLDVSNVLVGATLRGIGAQLKTKVGFSAPEPFAERCSVNTLFRPAAPECALLVEVNFRLEARRFSCHLVMLMPQAEIDAIRGAIDQFVSSL